MVKGLELFREHFRNYPQCYVLIGGSACDVHMGEAGIPFRATKDLDLVLCVEALDEGFVQAFWNFIGDGGYSQRERSSGKKEFYRFQKPANANYPAQLELFSRQLENLPPRTGLHLTPIPVEGEADSLSAILLDNDYYQCIETGTEIIDGIRVLKAEFLLLFKARAYLDLRKRKETDDSVKGDDIRKHRLDIFRISRLFSPKQKVVLPEPLRAHLWEFLDDEETRNTDVSAFGMRGSASEILESIRRMYGVG